MEKIAFTVSETGEEVELYVVEETKFHGYHYLLVTESDDEEEADAYILKDLSKSEEEEANYIFLEDDKEIEAVSEIFAELLEDVKLQ